MHRLELRIPPPVVMLFFCVLVLVTKQGIAIYRFDTDWSRPLGWVLILLGLVSGAAGVLRFRKESTTIDPSNPYKTSYLVKNGLYRISRNPMYLGLGLILIGIELLTAELAGMIWVLAFFMYMTRFQILPEERALSQKFGDEFKKYKQKTRRWI